MNVLDNPIFHALQTTQHHFSEGNEQVLKFKSSILPFAGANTNDGQALTALLPFMENGETLFIKDQFDQIPSEFQVMGIVNCWQMVYTPGNIQVPITADVAALTGEDAASLFQLVDTVQPGFFKPGTSSIGQYFGIRSEGQLVAVAGERFRMPGFTELSAICTLPTHTGKGYAQQLIQVLCEHNLANGQQVLLHVVDSNERAIKVYEKMGFAKRMDLPLLKLKKVSDKLS